MSERRKYPCQPTDTDLPYVDGCQRCNGLKSDPQPGLFVWVEMLAFHMDEAHGLLLVGR